MKPTIENKVSKEVFVKREVRPFQLGIVYKRYQAFAKRYYARIYQANHTPDCGQNPTTSGPVYTLRGAHHD